MNIDITKLMKAEEEISKFKTIADQANYGNAVADLDGNLIYINKHFANMHGYKPEELIGNNLSIFHNKKQTRQVQKINQQLQKYGNYNLQEVWHVHKDGTAFPTLMNGTIIYDEDGNASFMAATAIDITKHKKAEDALRNSEERYRSVVENANEGILIIQSGYSAEELSSKFFLEFIHPDDRKMVLNYYQKRLKGLNVPERYSFRIIHKDGSIRWLEITSTMITWENRPAVLSLLYDITKRKKAEKEILENHKRIYALMNSTTESMLLIDKNGKFLAANEIAAKRLNSSIDKLVGSDYTIISSEIMPPEMIKSRLSLLNRIIKTGKPVRCQDERDGIIFDTNYFPVFDAQGNVDQVAIFAMDITQRKKAEDALRNSEERYRSVVENANEGILIIQIFFKVFPGIHTP